MSPLPELQSRFTEFMVNHNRSRMDGFKGWAFRPGMRFQAGEKWWGDQGLRAVPHEGLDLYCFEAADGEKTVDGETKIPAVFAGRVVKIEPDFLGQSIFISHGIHDGVGRQLISAFGHTVPKEGLRVGQPVVAGEIIARVAGVPGKKSGLPPHLHLTLAWVPADFRVDQLTWKNLGADPGIRLIDPLPVIAPADE